MKIIGLTGASGSGKSTVVAALGFPVVDADKAARVAVEDKDCLNALVESFGKEILNEDKTLNRKELAKRAFISKEKTDVLNSITHPFIIKIMNDEIEKLKLNGEKAIVLDAPQLFEAKCEDICDVVIGVLADKNIRMKRIIARDNINEDDASIRLSAEKSDEFFKSRCDYVIINNGSVETLKLNADEILRKIGIK